MNLAHPDARRGLRSFVMAIVVLALLYFVWEWAARLDPQALREVVRGALILIGIAQVGYQFENGMRAFKLSAGKDGFSMEGQGDPGDENKKLQSVADAAQDRADEVKS